MTRYNSPLGNFNIDESEIRKFEVPDETESPAPKPRPQRPGHLPPLLSDEQIEILRKKQEQEQSQNEFASDAVKDRINVLLGIVKKTKNVNIDNINYELTLFSGLALRKAILDIMKYDGTVEASFETRKQFLARALTKIDNVDVENFLASKSFQDKLKFIELLPDYLQSRLFDEYQKFRDEVQKKYSISSDNVKEVVEEIKK